MLIHNEDLNIITLDGGIRGGLAGVKSQQGIATKAQWSLASSQSKRRGHGRTAGGAWALQADNLTVLLESSTKTKKLWISSAGFVAQ